MTVEIIRKRLKQYFIEQQMMFESNIIDIISDAEVMKYNRKMRLKRVWAK